MTSILITTPIRNSEPTLWEYLTSIEDNITFYKYRMWDKGIGDFGVTDKGRMGSYQPEIGYYFISHDNNDRTLDILDSFCYDNPNANIESLKSGVDLKAERHDWTNDQIMYLSKLRDLCLNRAEDHNYDYVLMVDSDVILQKQTLHSLIELSQGEHVVNTAILAHWDKGKIHTNYNKVMGKRIDYDTGKVDPNKYDDYNGLQVTTSEIGMDFKTNKPIEVSVAFMSWLIPVKLLDRLSFAGSGERQFDFKIFSKLCRDNNIKQVVDFKYPATHIEKSGVILKYKESY